MDTGPKILSTEDVAPRERRVWLREVIGREYADVEITPPGDGSLFNEMTIHPWEALRLSAIRSNAITIERLSREARSPGHDSYLAVILLSGDYALEQDGREARLRPGDMAIYDAARPHRIRCPGKFAKVIVSIPRPLLRDRIAGIEHCTARHIPGDDGIGAVASSFIRAAAIQAGRLRSREFAALAGHSLDLLAMTALSVRPAACRRAAPSPSPGSRISWNAVFRTRNSIPPRPRRGPACHPGTSTASSRTSRPP